MTGCGGGLPQSVVPRSPRWLPLPHRRGQRSHSFPDGSACPPPPRRPSRVPLPRWRRFPPRPRRLSAARLLQVCHKKPATGSHRRRSLQDAAAAAVVRWVWGRDDASGRPNPRSTLSSSGRAGRCASTPRRVPPLFRSRGGGRGGHGRPTQRGARPPSPARTPATTRGHSHSDGERAPRGHATALT